jgi:hypothetical protein
MQTTAPVATRDLAAFNEPLTSDGDERTLWVRDCRVWLLRAADDSILVGALDEDGRTVVDNGITYRREYTTEAEARRTADAMRHLIETGTDIHTALIAAQTGAASPVIEEQAPATTTPSSPLTAGTVHVWNPVPSPGVGGPRKLTAEMARTATGRKVHRVTSVRPDNTDCDRGEQIVARLGELPIGEGLAALVDAILDANVRPVQLCAHCFTRDIRQAVAAEFAARRAEAARLVYATAA